MQQLLFRHAISLLDMNTAQLSIMDICIKQLLKVLLEASANCLKADLTELHTLCLADRVLDLAICPLNSNEVIKSVVKRCKGKK